MCVNACVVYLSIYILHDYLHACMHIYIYIHTCEHVRKLFAYICIHMYMYVMLCNVM